MPIGKSHTNQELNFGLAAQKQYSSVLRPGLCQDLPSTTGMAQIAVGSVLKNNRLKFPLWPASHFTLPFHQQTGWPLCAVCLEGIIHPVVIKRGRGRARGCWVAPNGKREMVAVYHHNLYIVYYFTHVGYWQVFFTAEVTSRQPCSMKWNSLLPKIEGPFYSSTPSCETLARACYDTCLGSLSAFTVLV